MSDETHIYTGWLVDPEARAALLARLPPRYATVKAHHVTLTYGDAAAEPPPDAAGAIVGVADDGAGVQAMVVAVDGVTRRPDGATFHVTWSLAEGREARESNDVIAERGWTAMSPPIPLTLVPMPRD